MKNLLLVIVIGFLLVGCDDSNKKVADEMLAGDWACETSHYESSWSDNGFSDFIKKGKALENKMSAKFENGKLYLLNPQNNEWTEGSIVGEYDNKPVKKDNNKILSSYTQSISIKNNDTFVLSHESEYVAKDKNFSHLNQKSNDETICTRIN